MAQQRCTGCNAPLPALTITCPYCDTTAAPRTRRVISANMATYDRLEWVELRGSMNRVGIAVDCRIVGNMNEIGTSVRTEVVGSMNEIRAIS